MGESIAIAGDHRGRSEEVENRIAENKDSSSRIPSSAGQEEDTALEDVLIITTDKSLDDEMVPAEEDEDGQRRKDRSKDKDDSREKVKERVRKGFGV